MGRAKLIQALRLASVLFVRISTIVELRSITRLARREDQINQTLRLSLTLLNHQTRIAATTTTTASSTYLQINEIYGNRLPPPRTRPSAMLNRRLFSSPVLSLREGVPIPAHIARDLLNSCESVQARNRARIIAKLGRSKAGVSVLRCEVR